MLRSPSHPSSSPENNNNNNNNNNTVSRRKTQTRIKHNLSLLPYYIKYPFLQYSRWVFHNQENSFQLEKLTRSFSMIFSNPSNLLQMELFWSLSKLHGLVNQILIQHHYNLPPHHRNNNNNNNNNNNLPPLPPNPSEGEALTNHNENALQEGDEENNNNNNNNNKDEVFLNPKEWTQLLLGIISEVESIIEIGVRNINIKTSFWYNKCGSRRLPPPQELSWRVMLAIQVIKLLLNVFLHQNIFIYNFVWRAIGQSLRRLLHRLRRRLLQVPYLLGWKGGENNNNNNDNNNLMNNENNKVKEETSKKSRRLVIPRLFTSEDKRNNNNNKDNNNEEEAITPYSFIDVLGITADLYTLFRPLLLTAGAFYYFPRVAGGKQLNPSIGLLPVEPEDNNEINNNNDEINNNKMEEKDSALLTCALRRTVHNVSLSPSKKLWLFFFVMDAINVLVSKYIQRYRTPVVFLEETETFSNPHHHNNNNEEENTARSGSVVPLASTAAVVRDGYRVQHTFKLLYLNFLRDPFFSLVLKQYVERFLLKGWLSRIPILGALLSFQVGYVLSLQHFSFLYSVGE